MDWMSDERLDLDACPGSPECAADATGNRISAILHGVIQPGDGVTPQKGAESLDQILRNLQFRSQDKEKDAEVVQSFLSDVWSAVVRLIKRVPQTHPGQGRVASMLESLVEISEGKYHMWGNEMAVWEDLPMLGPEMRESWNWTATPKEGASYLETEGAQAWINLNSFGARLVGLKVVKWENFAIWGLRDALEEKHSSLAERDVSVVVAGQWLFHAGEVLFEGRTKGCSADDSRSLRVGCLFQGGSGLSQERWDFWKRRMEAISEDVSGDVRAVAVAARRRMQELEDKKLEDKTTT